MQGKKKKKNAGPHSSFTGAGSSESSNGRIEPATMMTGSPGLLASQASQGPVIGIEIGIGIHEGSQSTAAKPCAFCFSDIRRFLPVHRRAQLLEYYCLACRRSITHGVTWRSREPVTLSLSRADGNQCQQPPWIHVAFFHFHYCLVILLYYCTLGWRELPCLNCSSST